MCGSCLFCLVLFVVPLLLSLSLRATHRCASTKGATVAAIPGYLGLPPRSRHGAKTVFLRLFPAACLACCLAVCLLLVCLSFLWLDGLRQHWVRWSPRMPLHFPAACPAACLALLFVWSSVACSLSSLWLKVSDGIGCDRSPRMQLLLHGLHVKLHTNFMRHDKSRKLE